MSSQDIIKSVSKKLKYYFEVRRLEDGFDLSGTDAPKLDHPPLKAHPTLFYDGLHDRPLKHYFRPPLRTTITHLKSSGNQDDRERHVRKVLEAYMKRYHFVVPALHDTYYKPSKRHGRRLRPETVGFGVGLKRKTSPCRGGMPVLRSTPTANLSKGEANRLIAVASKLLVATETVNSLGSHEQKKRPKSVGSRSSQSSKSLPLLTTKEERSRHRPKSEKERRRQVCYDINGRQVRQKKYDEVDQDSAYSTPRDSSPVGNYVTINGKNADDDTVPIWLKKQMSRSDVPTGSPTQNEWVRPHSASPNATTLTLRPPAAETSRLRPKSSKFRSRPDPLVQRGIEGGFLSAAWVRAEGEEEREEEDEGRSTDRSTEMGTQTGGELLRDYDPMETVLLDGDLNRYEITVVTGDRMGASTKAEVKVILCGDKGRTEEIYLKNSRTHKIAFQKGMEDIFDVNCFYVGPLRKISIGHDRKEIAYSWFLYKVIVKDLTHQIRHEIACDKWLSAKDADDRTIKEFSVKFSTMFREESESESPRTYTPVEHVAMTVTPIVTTATAATPQQPHPATVSEPETSRTSMMTQRSDSTSGPALKQTAPEAESDSETTTDSDSDSSSYDTSTENTPDVKSPTPTSPKGEKTPNEVVLPSPPVEPVIPPKKPLRRRDTFFDQRTTAPDFSKAIETLPKTTSEDDFNSDCPQTSRSMAAEEDEGEEEEEEEEESSSESDMAVLSPRDVDGGGEGSDRPYSRAGRPKLPDTTPKKQVVPPAIEEETSTSSTLSSRESDRQLLRGPTMHHAANAGDLDTVMKWVVHNSELKTSTDERGWTALHIAASRGKLDIVQWLSVSMTDLDIETPTGYSAMHMAAMHGHTNCMMVLSAMGAKLECRSVEQQTPLHLAAISGHLGTVKWLLSNRASTTLTDAMSRTPLDVAVEYRHDDVATLLRQQESSTTTHPTTPGPSQREETYLVSVPELADKRSLEEDDSRIHGESDDTAQMSPRTPLRPKTAMASSRRANSDELGSSSSSGSDSDDDANYDSGDIENGLDGDAQEESTSERRKHDEQLMEKRRIYDEQKKRMSTQHVSFLDAVRKDYEDEDNV